MKVLKRNNKYELFDGDKIRASINRACIKLPVKADEIEEIIHEVQSRIWRNPSREITSTEIGEIILDYLKRFHQLAYLRFASVFYEYETIEDLIDKALELKKELETRERKEEQTKEPLLENTTEKDTRESDKTPLFEKPAKKKK